MAVVLGYAVHPAIGAGLAAALVVLELVDWRAASSALLASFAVLLILVPGDLELQVGSPIDLTVARVVLLLLFATWAFRLLGVVATPLPEDAKRAGYPLLGLLAVALVSVLVNAQGALESGEDTGLKPLFILASYVGVYFLSLAVIDGRGVEEWILAVVAGAGAMVGLAAVLERFSGVNVLRAAFEAVPGLGAAPIEEALVRGSGIRVAGTGEHAIAFGGAMAMVLPLAVYLTIRGQGRRRLLWGSATAAVGMALLLSVSRSSLLAAAVGFSILFIAWPKYRMAIVMAAVLGMFAVHMIMPGLLGTFRKTLSPDYLAKTESAENPYNRASDYARLAEIVPRQPLLGIGYNQFDPRQYFFLDNQILKLLVELGVAGTLLMGLFIWRHAVLLAQAVRAGPVSEPTMSGALLAALCAFVTLSAFFDTFAFDQVTYLFFIIAALGVRVACTERLASATPPVDPSQNRCDVSFLSSVPLPDGVGV